MAAHDPKLPLGVRKLKRLLQEAEKKPATFAGEHGIDRLKLARVLAGKMARIDIDFIDLVVRCFPRGTLDPLDFAQRTVSTPDSGAQSHKGLRVVGTS